MAALVRRISCTLLHESAVGLAWLNNSFLAERSSDAEAATLQEPSRLPAVAEANSARRDEPCDGAAPVRRCWLRAE